MVTSSIGGLLGGFLTFVGVLINKREAKRRERAAWVREDAARSYEHRRAAYVDFIKEYYRLLDEYHLEDSAEERFAPDYLVPLYDRLVQIQVLGHMKPQWQ